MKGGRWQRRDHVHCATSLPVDGLLPAGFRKQGVDCIIHIDAAALLEYYIEMFMSDANVIFIPTGAPVEAIKYVVLLKYPQLTVYKRPTPSQLYYCNSNMTTCRLCGGEWQLGTWLCLKCWEPLSFYGTKRFAIVSSQQRGPRARVVGPLPPQRLRTATTSLLKHARRP